MTQPNRARILDAFEKCDDPAALRRMMKNAKQRGGDDVYNAAFQRLITVQPSAQVGTIAHDVWRAIYAFEEVLREERGRRVPLARTRQKTQRVGELAERNSTMNPLLAFVMAIGLALPALAHEAPRHAHAALVPVPACDPPCGEAGAAASLRAAEAFLESLDEAMRAKLVYELDAEERTEWSNLPARFVTRAGVSVGELSDHQRRLLFEFLASSLGEAGYRRVADAMAAEAFLSADGLRAWFAKWAPQNYWISFYGAPSEVGRWGWRFGGHHLALNLSVENNRVTSMSPSFVGTEPAVFTLDGVAYEAVVDMHRAGYALHATLDPAQQAAADAGAVPDELLTGAGKDGVVPPAIGLSAAEMTPDQRALLLAAIAKWVSIQPAASTARRMAEIEADLDRTRFAWTGSDAVNTPAYMRIQGPALVVELLSTGGNVGANASGRGHYHTVYRNPALEYGGARPGGTRGDGRD